MGCIYGCISGMQSTGLFRYPAEACGSDSSIIRQLCDISDRNKILIHSAIFLIVHGWGFLFTEHLLGKRKRSIASTFFA